MFVLFLLILRPNDSSALISLLQLLQGSYGSASDHSNDALLIYYINILYQYKNTPIILSVAFILALLNIYVKAYYALKYIMLLVLNSNLNASAPLLDVLLEIYIYFHKYFYNLIKNSFIFEN